ncbi:MAG: hypothetical protein IJQ11_04745 [Bacteroidales bacterium]|nr:hypothetical protein [Bacteroidales bacterium]MBR0176715.1 hypothetical protein [Bacteroidales bacterium]
MKPENEMNEEVRQLLNSLEEHGKNTCRQRKLSDLIDQLSEKELGTGTRNDAKRRKLYPLWWAMGAAAACLLLWLLFRPSMKQQPEMEQEILVEETNTVDSTKAEVKDFNLEEPVINYEVLLAEETTVAPQKVQIQKEKARKEVVEKVEEQPILAEVIPTEPKDTTNIGSNTIPTENETPSAVQKPQRRVIRSLNLVCYECQKEPEFFIKPVMEDRTLFGQPQDQNMKNGSLALEIKLN